MTLPKIDHRQDRTHRPCLPIVGLLLVVAFLLFSFLDQVENQQKEAHLLLQDSDRRRRHQHDSNSAKKTQTSGSSSIHNDESKCRKELQAFFYEGIEEHQVYSQNGEDGVIQALLARFGGQEPALKYYVEFGTEEVTLDKGQINTRLLREKHGYQGLLMDGGWENAAVNQHKHMISADNIVSLFQHYKVPYEFNLLSIDLDYDDYWVWQALLLGSGRQDHQYRPRIVITEYNAKLGLDVNQVVNLKDSRRWTGTDYFGASWQAMKQLGQANGYTLVYAERVGVNLFFVRTDLLQAYCHEMATTSRHSKKTLQQTTFELDLDDRVLYQPPRYGFDNGGHPQETNLKRKYVVNPDPLALPNATYPPPVVI